VQQVILNLILNAAAAMSHGMLQSPRIVLRTELREDEGVKVSLRDFGAGIDEEHKDRLFEPFYTTKPEGLGMGLAICRSIVDAHGGTIWAENNPDGGATLDGADPETPVCLLLDVRMPGMSGFQLREVLVASQTTDPVIFTTGHDRPGMEGQALNLGAVAYLRKPFEEQAILDAIQPFCSKSSWVQIFWNNDQKRTRRVQSH